MDSASPFGVGCSVDWGGVWGSLHLDANVSLGRERGAGADFSVSGPSSGLAGFSGRIPAVGW